ncbi:hypothetical protein ECANGB1_230 [Enterospora canceri]|uniref:Uncharacterized protein n=1 Tax=Enterospora canceri TaxID=1081671 RepID=A0A1Y1S9E0_9MICR|nr:hypothetical protein ECANGB1_230 [Enterospora canceri]
MKNVQNTQERNDERLVQLNEANRGIARNDDLWMGQTVLYCNRTRENKFDERFSHSFRITKIHRLGTYTIINMTSDLKIRAAGNDIKPYTLEDAEILFAEPPESCSKAGRVWTIGPQIRFKVPGPLAPDDQSD